METASAPIPDETSAPTPMSYLPVKAGHPRWNLAVALALVALVLALALVEAQRLSLGY